MDHPVLRWAIFCQVIDNFGDIGVCWRLAADLAQRGHAVCLWVDDSAALAWMAPQGTNGVQVLPYDAPWNDAQAPNVVIEAFGCEAPPAYLLALAQRPVPLINLEYLSAEGYVERCHRLPSPVMGGPGAGLTRWFFYPGFTARTGGLLREPGLAARQAAFDRDAWRAARGIGRQEMATSLFCYEPPALGALLSQFASASPPTHLLVTPGRAAAAVRALPPPPALPITWLAPCPQPEFDRLLWACDLNLVRGEDSLVRALWAGQALVWQIYPQHDNAHHDKLMAFLDWLQAPPTLRRFHAAWNGLDNTPLVMPAALTLAEWTACVQAARAQLLMQDNLVAQLWRFVREKR